MSGELDARLNVFRPDLAAADLRGRVKAERFVSPRLAQVVETSAPLHLDPRFDAEMTSEALFGERVHVYEEHEGWAWAQLLQDRYVGYMPAACLGPPEGAPSHHVSVLRTFVFSRPDIKSHPIRALSMGSLVRSEGTEGIFEALSSGGFVIGGHLRREGEHAADWVEVAEGFVGTPYLWGGKQSTGLDCSGLIQIAARSAGLDAPRDSDMQCAHFGKPVDVNAARRGDIVFWKGHVGVFCDARTLLHANAFHMLCVREPFAQAGVRIGAAAGAMLQCNRLP